MPDFAKLTKPQIREWMDALDPPVVYARSAAKDVLADVALHEWERRLNLGLPTPPLRADPERTPKMDTEAAPIDRDRPPDVETPRDRTVLERIHAVLADLPAIGKDSRAPDSMGAYAFRGIEAITAALKPMLAKHGLVMIPSIVERLDSVRTTGSNKNLYVTDLLLRVTFYGTTPPSDEPVVAEMWGQGSDSGDKAVSKAATSAFKSLLAVSFCIADAGSDTEAHDVPDTQPPPPEPTREEIAQQLGFDDPDHATAEVARVRALVAEASKVDSTLPGWIKDQGFPWPWPKAVCEAVEAAATKALNVPADTGASAESAAADPTACPKCGGSLDRPPLEIEPGRYCPDDRHLI